ncbi:MAG: zinc ribbon domain-containing protein [Methanoregula sp.]|nr:zinc ribbon domain-containing protein [Methanoregula sp.]
MFCGECGTQNPDTNQFCKNCGKPLARRQAAAPVPAYQPAPVPAAPQFSPPAPALSVPYQHPVAAATPAAPPGRRWNWLGMVSIIPGVLSLGILPLILGLSAILLGIAGTFMFRKTTGRIGISGIIGIILGIAAVVMTIVLT